MVRIILFLLLIGVAGLGAAWIADQNGEVLLVGLYSAVYTALIAPYGHWVLKRLRGLLGIGAPHRVRVG